MSKISCILDSLVILVHVSSSSLGDDIKSSEHLEPLDEVCDLIVINGGFTVFDVNVHLCNTLSGLHESTHSVTSDHILIGLIEDESGVSGQIDALFQVKQLVDHQKSVVESLHDSQN